MYVQSTSAVQQRLLTTAQCRHALQKTPKSPLTERKKTPPARTLHARTCNGSAMSLCAPIVLIRYINVQRCRCNAAASAVLSQRQHFTIQCIVRIVSRFVSTMHRMHRMSVRVHVALAQAPSFKYSETINENSANTAQTRWRCSDTCDLVLRL